MEIAFYIFVSLFVISSFVHLGSCLSSNDKFRQWTKCFPLFFLSLSSIFAVRHELMIILLPLGLFSSSIGDLFLLRDDTKIGVMVGGFFFLLTHVVYFYGISQSLSREIPWWAYLIMALCVGGAIFLGFFKTHFDTLKGGILGYLTTLLVLIALSVTAVVIHPGFPTGMILFGYLVFFVSDCLLFYSIFIREFKHRHFYIMLTYLAAEFLISFGLMYLF